MIPLQPYDSFVDVLHACLRHLKQHGDDANHSIQVILLLSLSLQQSGAMQQQL